MNERIKFILWSSLGTFGQVLFVAYQILSLVAIFVPLLFLDLSIWIHFVLCILLFMPTLGPISEFILYCITFPVVLSEPLSFWTVLYYISIATFMIPKVIGIVILIIEKISERRNHW